MLEDFSYNDWLFPIDGDSTLVEFHKWLLNSNITINDKVSLRRFHDDRRYGVVATSDIASIHGVELMSLTPPEYALCGSYPMDVSGKRA